MDIIPSFRKERKTKTKIKIKPPATRTHSILFVCLLVGWLVPWSTPSISIHDPTAEAVNSNRGTNCMLINGPWCVRRRITTAHAAASSTASIHTCCVRRYVPSLLLRLMLAVVVLSIAASALVSSSSSFRPAPSSCICICVRVCVCRPIISNKCVAFTINQTK